MPHTPNLRIIQIAGYLAFVMAVFTASPAFTQKNTWLQPRMFKVTPYLYNSPYADIPVTFQGDYLFFTSDRHKRNTPGKPSGDFNLYSSHSEYGKIHLAPTFLDKRVNTGRNETGATWSVLNSRLYFTRGSFDPSPLPSAKPSPAESQLMVSERPGTKYSPAGPLWFSGPAQVLLSPAINDVGDLIVFASNDGKGYGGFDLYFTEYRDGKWTEPVNLGPGINTSGNEIYPCLAREGDSQLLFFSSDSRPDNWGGYDLYLARRSSGEFEFTGHLAEPFNSLSDDVGFVIRRDLASGYFGSDRNSAGNIDIFAFDQHFILYSTVVDGETGSPVENAIVRIRNSSNDNVVTLQTDSTGSFYHPYTPQSLLLVNVVAQGYDSISQRVDPEPKLPQNRSRNYEFSIKPSRKLMVEGTVTRNDLGLSGVKVYLQDGSSQPQDSMITNGTGRFRFNLKPDRDYFLVCEKEGLRTSVTQLSTHNVKVPSTLRSEIRMTSGDFLYVEGQVTTVDQTLPLENIPVRVLDNNTNQVIDTIYTRRNGYFWLSIPIDSLTNYSVIASTKGYLSTRMDVERDSTGARKVVLKLRVPEFGEDKLVKVIYYPYNSAILTPLSRKDINELYYFLVENPDVNLELGSHTDARGGDTYNQALSEKRAESALNFILERQEIPRDRMLWKGYGESKPTNNCVDGHPCTEEGYQLNRRTEFRVRLRTLPQ